MSSIGLDVGITNILEYISNNFNIIAVGEGTLELASTITALDDEITTGGLEAGEVDVSDIDGKTLTINKSFSVTASFDVTEAILMNDEGEALVYLLANVTKSVSDGDTLIVEFIIELDEAEEE